MASILFEHFGIGAEKRTGLPVCQGRELPLPSHFRRARLNRSSLRAAARVSAETGLTVKMQTL
jgi:hypothetical protein